MAGEKGCVFCAIIAKESPADVVQEFNGGVTAIVPLDPVVDGHVIFIPHEHVADAAVDPQVTAKTFEAAAWYCAEQEPMAANIITSIGVPASQSVFHLHVHVVPRRPDDGLALPWTNQKKAS